MITKPFFIDPLSAPVRQCVLAVALLIASCGASAWHWMDAREDAVIAKAELERRCPPPVARGYRVISWLEGGKVRCQVVIPIGAVVSAK